MATNNLRLLCLDLPAGYSEEALYLRRWILDLRLRLAAIPLERQRMLERTIYEFSNSSANKRPGDNRKSNAYLLARAVG
jgi:hypothetical protein